MKFYIMTDMEGVSGIVNSSYCLEEGSFYEKGKRLTTLEVNAAIEGILSTGNHDIIVCDGHGPGGLEIELLHKEARMIMGRPLDPLFQMNAEPYDAFLMIGQHAMKNAPKANLDHTFNSRTIKSLKINDIPMGEAGVNALRAGFYQIPTIYLSGDQAACAEIEALIPNIHTCSVKQAITSTSAICLQPEKARDKIRTTVAYAIQNMKNILPYEILGPFEAILQFTDSSSLTPYIDKGYCTIISGTQVKIYADTIEQLLKSRLWAQE